MKRKTTIDKVYSTIHEENNQPVIWKHGNIEPAVYDMLVFSHLRWDFVYQRPQHLIERLSKHYRILVIEEPTNDPTAEGHTASLCTINDKLHVLQPHHFEVEEVKDILKASIANEQIPIGWFYSAAFVPFLQHFNFAKVVYDCMDELTMFKGASPILAAQEKYLLSEANIVFTGGKFLFESKQQQHDNVFCFPSSVDRPHFEKALNGIAIPKDMKLKHPIVGYYGVIDERIDMELLQKVAERMPEVSFVMVGPLAKIEEHDLPRLPNIHYTGIKSYSELPAYLKAFDIAMMPFAINDATKYISPTKTLEYMAAQKPVISTPVRDVVRDYAHCIEIVETADEFCDAIGSLLQSNEMENEVRNQQYEVILKATSWDKTAEKMFQLIQKKEKA